MVKVDKGFMRGASLGIELAVSVMLFAFLGYQVDRLYGFKPWAMVCGVVLGSMVGMWNVYKIAIKDFK